MYDPLWEEHPRVKQIRAESLAKGRLEGEAEGKAKGQQRAVISIVTVRFPKLTEFAQQKLVKVYDLNMLDLLLKQVISAPDEESVCRLLDHYAVASENEAKEKGM
jgi:hypothetical protein